MNKQKISLSQLERINYQNTTSPKDRYIEQMLSCGKGRVVDDKDATPGFRSHDVFIECDVCREKYEIE